MLACSWIGMDRGAVDNSVVELLGQPAVVVRVEVAAMPKVDGYGAETLCRAWTWSGKFIG